MNLYIDFFRNIKGFANPQLVSVSAIAGDVPGGCATAVEGRRYSDAVSQLNGQFESICTQSWSQMLMNIGLDVFTLRTAWTLTRPADPATDHRARRRRRRFRRTGPTVGPTTPRPTPSRSTAR